MSRRGMIPAIALGILLLGASRSPQAEEARCTKTHSTYRWNGGVIKHQGKQEPADCIKKSTSPAKSVANEEKTKPAQTTIPTTEAVSCTKAHSTYRWNGGVVKHFGEQKLADCIKKNPTAGQPVANAQK